MRLTEKDIAYITSGANVIEIPDVVEGHKYTGQAIIKLGQLEDIEEKLGIDLITLSKLFKAQEVYAYGHNGIQKCYNDCVSIYDKTIAIYNGVCVREYPLSEYGKSFALTKEELEK